MVLIGRPPVIYLASYTFSRTGNALTRGTRSLILSLKTDPHDHIASGYGLTVSEVCVKATKVIILESGKLDVLAFNYHRQLERGFFTVEDAKHIVR